MSDSSRLDSDQELTCGKKQYKNVFNNFVNVEFMNCEFCCFEKQLVYAELPLTATIRSDEVYRSSLYQRWSYL